jgi:hypothetical protein
VRLTDLILRQDNGSVDRVTCLSNDVCPRDNNSGPAAWYLIESDLLRLPSGHASVVNNGGCCCAGRLPFIANGCFEATDAFSDSFSEFRKLFWSEDEQGNSDDN